MKFETVNLVYFSATEVSRKYAKAMGRALDSRAKEYDFTTPAKRDTADVPSFTENDLVILSLPVYGGRVPTICLDYLSKLKGRGTPCVVVCTYGNRAFEDALVEMEDIMDSNGFNVVGGAAVVGRHSFSDEIAGNRPTKEDLEGAEEFIKLVVEKENVKMAKGIIPGNRPYKEKANRVNTMMPKTLDTCINCKYCAKMCPNGVISMEDPRIMVKDASQCLRCSSCVVRCPVHAKYFDGEDWQKAVRGAIARFGKPDKVNQYFM